MSTSIKSQEAILSKLGIEQLNPMQKEAQQAIATNAEVMLLSPTGTGKTLAFLLPLIDQLDETCDEIQMVIIVPSRELAIQIEQVMREMGTGFKVNAVYGGRAGSKDRMELKHRPAVLIGTPGRVADHLRREAFDTQNIKTLVLDEFDKSLEIGFEEEMQDILELLPQVNKKVLTSATKGVEIPGFVRLKAPVVIDYLEEKVSQLKVKKVISPSKDKLDTLIELLGHVGNQNGIIFCNFKDSIQRVSDFLFDHNISHGTFFGGMEQGDRERALIKFRNGTHQILLATDLAARGIDVPEIKFIIHYHLPIKSEEFTHRNGRTARMNSDGTAYVLQYENEALPDFIGDLPIEELTQSELPKRSGWSTLFISGGRKDKISKGDVAGLFFKQGNLTKDELGVIELKNDCAFVAVKTETIKSLLPKVNNVKLKKKKVRVSIV
ncbi:DEAD/DEAH box helicase [Fulvivirga lutimaris]|uniref:DEAD/DEAH box helicase n=1 Tax=Fulvivirga lutimaris TaxID=1819566 RepID=UPI0012BB523F|nr:DEAD/DEAH box helicase [Fulvivirga lutimaris]MTI38835.1 DEAD/DEAH box helicase [Fulvivirga lutimaris]